MIVYIIGALKNPEVPKLARVIRKLGHDVYDEWHCPGPDADKFWQAYCDANGLTYQQALNSWHCKQIFEIDKFHLDRCDAAILVLPAGKSGHLELGYVKGLGKKAYILLDGEPDKFDIMYRFADLVTTDIKEIALELK